MSSLHTQSYDNGDPVYTTRTPDNRDEAHNMPRNGQGSTTAAAGNRYPKERFDEYGAELGQDARVWQTYVKVADKSDTEQVDGWNRSLDVTLIFAALFTAICTAFVIESSKSLKEDPTEVSTQQLVGVLFAIANGTNQQQFNPTQTQFSPRLVDICVNALWFFSLTLSASVSLVAMLAKEWCHLFMSNRIGEPWSQTKSRQRRLEGIEKWRLKHVIMFLPSFIHLAFLSFSIGVCIYLWDLNMAVAIPAIVVTIGSILVYMASTLFPFLDDACPYSTTISRILNASFKGPKGKSPYYDDEQRGLLAIKALAWLIKTSEDPKSTNIALQAIAGADYNEAHRELLKQYQADAMISWRLIDIDPYSKDHQQILNLYTRAQSFFQQDTRAGNFDPNRELQKQVRRLRDITNSQISKHIASSAFLPSTHNILALRIGSTAASHCLRSLGNGSDTKARELLESAIGLLESFRNNQAHLNPAEIGHLMTGVAMLISCLPINPHPSTGAQYVLRLLRTADPAAAEQKQLELEYLNLPLMAFTLSIRDYSGYWGFQSASPNPTSRAVRAIEAIAYYASDTSLLNQAGLGVRNLGLLGLLADPKDYNLVGGDFSTIRGAFSHISAAQATRIDIYTLSRGFYADIFPHTVTIFNTLLSEDENDYLYQDDAAMAYLTVLSYTPMVDTRGDTPSGLVYAFVVECVYQLVWDTEAYGPNTALDLMQRFSGYDSLSRVRNLAESLHKREVLVKLKELSETNPVVNDLGAHLKKRFACGQAWLLIDLALRLGTLDRAGCTWRRCLDSFIQDENLSPELARQKLEEAKGVLVGCYKATIIEAKPHEYFTVLERLFPQPMDSDNNLGATQSN